jgi:5-formyltetrahydrofolate cyclo-ligase
MESLLSEKAALRFSLKERRDALSSYRREEAKEALAAFVQGCAHLKCILSFASFGSEIDTSGINAFLARGGRLFLPKISKEHLSVFQVEDIKLQLVLHPFGFLEPNPQECTQIEASALDAILVPALGFDKKNHRLGYGKGFYDRFLRHYPKIPSFGVGFLEQYVPELPVTTSDSVLDKVYLF